MSTTVRGVVARSLKAPGGGHRHRRARSRSGRGTRRRAGVRRVPHRPALPRGRDQRRLPVPARPRGRGHRRRGRRPTSPRSRPATSWSSTGGRCAASAGRAAGAGRWYCFATHNADAEDDARRRHARSRPRSASARSPRRRSSPRARPPRSTRAPSPAAAGLLGCGVMAGFGAAMLHRRASAAATRSRCSAAAASATPRSPAPRLAGAHTIIAVDLDARKLEWAKEFGATHTVDASHDRPGRGDPRAHRRQRRRRVHRGGRQPEGARAGVLRPRPRRHASCRSACPTPDMTLPDLPMIEFFGRGGALKPSWYGDCLPSRDFPMLDRPVPAGPARPRPSS